MSKRNPPPRPPDDRSPLIDRRREYLHTGTYLHTYCPHCGYDLADESWVRLQVIGPAGEQGELRLSPRFNVFQREATIPLEPGTELKDLLCPRCEESIVAEDRGCGQCRGRAAKLRISVVHLDLDLYFCLRVGCPWHGLGADDERRVVLDQSPDE